MPPWSRTPVEWRTAADRMLRGMREAVRQGRLAPATRQESSWRAPAGARLGSPCCPTRRSPMPYPRNAHIPLLEADAGFASGIPLADRPLADRVLVLPRLDLDPGPWTPPAPARGDAEPPLALVLAGLIGRHVALGERVATYLLGPGDVFDPRPAAGDDLLP